MPTYLCVTEKASIARQISFLLNPQHNQIKESKFFSSFHFQANINREIIDFIIIHCCGHNSELEVAQQTNSPQDFFVCKLNIVLSQTGIQFKSVLRRYIQKATKLVLCLDNDREGEHIAYEVVEIAQCMVQVNIFPSQLPQTRKDCQKNIISQQSHVKALLVARCRFTQLTRDEIIKSLSFLDCLHTRDIEAVSIRQELDLRLGFSFSRLQKQKQQKIQRMTNFKQAIVKNKMPPNFTFGTCQIPTLGLVYYNRPQNLDLNSAMIINFKDLSPKFSSESFVSSLTDIITLRINNVLVQNPYLTIKVEQKEHHELPPVPLNTIELYKGLSSKMAAKQIIEAAEKLYQRGFISYPRSETQVYVDSLNLSDIVQNLASKSRTQNPENQFQKLAERTINNQQFSHNVQRVYALNKNRNLRNDQAHPPIHPLSIPNAQLDSGQLMVFDYIFRHFLATLSDDCIKLVHNMNTHVCDVKFQASQTYIKYPGWREILYLQKAEAIPIIDSQSFVKQVDELSISPISHQQEKITQQALISRMDDYGIGTDATIAQHIQNIQDRQYVNLQKGEYLVTEAGGNIVSLYENTSFAAISTSFRAMMELGLRCVADDQLKAAEIYNDCMSFGIKLFNQVVKTCDSH